MKFNGVSEVIESFRAAERDLAAKVVWAWLPDVREWLMWDDCAGAYVICAGSRFSCGVMLFGFFPGTGWTANPWSARPVLSRLLGRCEGEVWQKGGGVA